MNKQYVTAGVCIICMICLLVLSCSRTHEQMPQNIEKFDAGLRLKLAEYGYRDTVAIFDYLIQVHGPYDERMKERIESHNLTVISSIDTIILARGPLAGIAACAGYEFVAAISLSEVRKPLN